MLSVEDAKEKLNRPFDQEGTDRPARCYSRRDADALRRHAYRLLCPLMPEPRQGDDRRKEDPSN